MSDPSLSLVFVHYNTINCRLKVIKIHSNPVIMTSFIRYLIYSVRYSVVPINSPLLTLRYTTRL
jgi:hypothetical protein